MKLNFKKSIVIYKNQISKKEKKEIMFLIRKENKKSILSQLSENVLFNYLNLVVKSKFLILFSLKFKNKIVAYALVARKPSYLISEISSLKFLILLDLFARLKILTIINLFLTFSKIDNLFIDKNFIKLKEKSLNLNLLAVKENFQSNGVGKYFLKYIFNKLKVSKKNNITCETFSRRATKFYQNKFAFKVIGKKIRFFKTLTVLSLQET
jgi:hypothetical protein